MVERVGFYIGRKLVDEELRMEVVPDRNPLGSYRSWSMADVVL